MHDRGTIRVTTQNAGDMVRVEIWDDGPGIPPELHSRIFEPFFTTKPPGKGAGLSLDTVNRILSRYRGFINLESEAGIHLFPDQNSIATGRSLLSPPTKLLFDLHASPERNMILDGASGRFRDRDNTRQRLNFPAHPPGWCNTAPALSMGHVEIVELERKNSRSIESWGKYTFPSTSCVFSLSANTLPFQTAFAIYSPNNSFIYNNIRYAQIWRGRGATILAERKKRTHRSAPSSKPANHPRESQQSADYMQLPLPDFFTESM